MRHPVYTVSKKSCPFLYSGTLHKNAILGHTGKNFIEHFSFSFFLQTFLIQYELEYVRVTVVNMVADPDPTFQKSALFLLSEYFTFKPYKKNKI